MIKIAQQNVVVKTRKGAIMTVDEFIELMDLGVIKFPYEFKQEFISIAKKQEDSDEEIIEKYELSDAEIGALANIDLMKTETTSIYKYENAEKTTKTYALAKDKELAAFLRKLEWKARWNNFVQKLCK